MSKIKALITTLVLGSSSVAMASPSFSLSAGAEWSFGNRTSSGPVIRDHRTTTWTALSQPVSAMYGRTTIRLHNTAAFSTLKLQGVAGAAYVDNIILELANGRRQVIEVDRWIDSRSPVQLNVKNNRQISSVTINGSANRRASYQLFGHAQYPMYETPVSNPPVYQPPVYQPPVYQPPVYQGVLLGSGLDFAHSDGREFITVGAQKGSFEAIRIMGTSGTTFVKMVQIDFADGTSQFLSAINRELRAGQSFDLELDGHTRRAIARVTVWMKEDGHQVDYATGEFSLFAM